MTFPTVSLTPYIYGPRRDIDPLTGNLIVMAHGRLTINAVNRKIVCCIGILDEYMEDAADGLHDKSPDQLWAECEAAAVASVSAMDHRSEFVGIGGRIERVNSLEDMGIAPPKLKEKAA